MFLPLPVWTRCGQGAAQVKQSEIGDQIHAYHSYLFPEAASAQHTDTITLLVLKIVQEQLTSLTVALSFKVNLIFCFRFRMEINESQEHLKAAAAVLY